MKMFNLLAISLILFSSFVSLGSASAYITHAVNYDFEDWDISTTPNNWSSTSGVSKSTDSYSGTYSALIDINGGHIDQSINVLNLLGDSINVYIAVKTTARGEIECKFYDSGGSPIGFTIPTTCLNTDWEVKNFGLNVPSNAVTLKITLTNDAAGSTKFDYVLAGESITETEDNNNSAFNMSFSSSLNPNSTIITSFEDYNITDSSHGKFGDIKLYINDTLNDTITSCGVNCYIINNTDLSGGLFNFVISLPYNLPPDLYTPTNGSTIEKEFPPLYDDVTFTWEDVGTTCQIQVSEDTAFSNIVYSGETSSATKTISLAEGTYYWRVRSYDSVFGEHGEWSDVYDFLIVTTSSVSGTGVHGVVFEAESLGSSIPLPSALVTIYNDTYSDTTITGPEGYYQFPVSNGTYIVYATLSNYDTSSLLPVTVDGNYTILNIPLKESESYFSPHYVRFIVTDSWYWERYVGATVTVYEGESTTSLFSETTGTDGACGFELSENIKYRIVTTYGDITQTDYIYPTENTYYIVLEDITPNILPESQIYDIITINITKTEINSTHGEIAIQYNDTEDSTNSVYFVLGQTYSNGTLNILDTSAVYNGNCSVTFGVTDYLGQSYIIKAVIDHDSFGTFTKYYGVDFPSNNLPFTGKGIVYLCIIVLFVVAAQFGKADATSGAILLCGLTWLMWGMDIFVTFGEGVNTLIGLGLGIATAYAVLAYINKKRTEEGI